MSVRVLDYDLHVLNMYTRLPYRFGITTLTALPHVFLRLALEVDGRRQEALASEGLVPKWFTKDPEGDVADEALDMLSVIRAACRHAQGAGENESAFDLWLGVYEAQAAWAADKPHPPLLYNLGVALVERAVIDGVCKAKQMSFASALRGGALGVELGRVHPRLEGSGPGDWLPDEASRSIVVRHTVGLNDPLVDSDIQEQDRLSDGLPQSLEECIRCYGLTHFKVKLPATRDEAVGRFKGIAEVLGRNCEDFRFTVDGNECSHTIEAFRETWRAIADDVALRPFLERGLLFVEQPLHRDIALSDHAAEALKGWPERPSIIIDESDNEIGAVVRALECGYAGTSHKNCKGVFKGVANACLLSKLRQESPESAYVFSGEDLTNVGPIALQQDLAVMASLGLKHVERNGHHYLAGLSAFPAETQAAAHCAHGDLYRWNESGGRRSAGDGRSAGDRRFATLAIESGKLRLGSVVDAPFGCSVEIDAEAFTPIDRWTPDSLLAGE